MSVHLQIDGLWSGQCTANYLEVATRTVRESSKRGHLVASRFGRRAIVTAFSGTALTAGSSGHKDSLSDGPLAQPRQMENSRVRENQPRRNLGTQDDEARRHHKVECLAEQIRRVVNEAPPLTPKQRDQLALLLRGAGGSV